jgi:hypothetical protein
VPFEEAPYDSLKVSVYVPGLRICENGGAGRDRSVVYMTPREVRLVFDLNAVSPCGHGVPDYLPTSASYHFFYNAFSGSPGTAAETDR